MSQGQFSDDLKEKILCRLRAKNALDLSDAEIDRCLSGYVAPWLPGVTKKYRDCDFLSSDELKV